MRHEQPSAESGAPSAFGGAALAVTAEPMVTVLVADDEPLVRGITGRMLESAGFAVALAEDGAEAISLVTSRPGEFGAFLLDLMMPGMTAEALVAELQRIAVDVPIVLTSGYNADELSLRFGANGLAGFLQKPYGRDDLLGMIQAAMARVA